MLIVKDEILKKISSMIISNYSANRHQGFWGGRMGNRSGSYEIERIMALFEPSRAADVNNVINVLLNKLPPTAVDSSEKFESLSESKKAVHYLRAELGLQCSLYALEHTPLKTLCLNTDIKKYESKAFAWTVVRWINRSNESKASFEYSDDSLKISIPDNQEMAAFIRKQLTNHDVELFDEEGDENTTVAIKFPIVLSIEKYAERNLNPPTLKEIANSVTTRLADDFSRRRSVSFGRR